MYDLKTAILCIAMTCDLLQGDALNFHLALTSD